MIAFGVRNVSLLFPGGKTGRSATSGILWE
jgi:hypothetical protein